MSENQPPPTPAGQISPDGQFQWNGSAWVPNPNLPKQKKKHTVRNVILIILFIFIAGTAGCIALIGGAANEIDKSIKESENKVGGSNNPLTIVEGKAFEIDNLNYAAGWKVKKDAIGGVELAGFKVTNNRDEKDEAIVEVKFLKGTEVLALVDCTTEQIDVGNTVTLNCFSGDDFPTGYDKITINDTF